jgi:F5/8 type C domain-containing protein
MRKRQISPIPLSVAPSGEAWLDIERRALVEVTSEEDGYPIESALLGAENRGWRAASPAAQTIRLIFDEPQKLRRIWLTFEDSENIRTQEFVLRWSSDTGRSFREIVRQQWNFSPPDSIREIEDYTVELSDVTVLELTIVPDKSGGLARASLASLRLA